MNTSETLPELNWIAFADSKRISFGAPTDVATQAKSFVDAQPQTTVFMFDAVSSQRIDIDLCAPLPLVLRGVPKPVAPVQPEDAPQADAPRTAGRPKLGVTAREVTLMPRHWEWLASQPGGASVSLRKLIEHAMRAGKETDRIRLARESAYRFISAMAGDAAGFEEASRALFAGNEVVFRECIANWPADVREHALALMQAASPADTPAG
ncbi:DUF2239 family protein [Uliginosibacterium sp. H3]|uniref:DUF2239 family protein n=1 Tax=Uliginosibacterium silvisoli TaxID=3114758 RepID=A0ABU6K5S2_9RHOO|nr:DUF2239 family protein [Uliginosibacterium sp. H3]